MLDESQKIEVRTILGIRKGVQTYDFGSSPYTELEKKLDALTDAQEAKVEIILAEWAKVQFSTGRLSGEYSDDPAEKRAHIKRLMVDAVDFDPRDYGMGGSLTTGRA